MNKKPFYVMLGYVKIESERAKGKESEYPMKFRRR